jgi:hypothetical protein
LSDAWLSRAAVSTAVTNGGFDIDLAGWTDSDESGAVSQWGAGGFLQLKGTGTNYAYRDQQVTVAAPDQNVEHALRLIVTQGYVSIQVGTSAGDGTYWNLTELAPGSYSLACTPTGNFWIRLGSKTTHTSAVDSIAVEASGAVSLPVPWSTTAHFDSIRYEQSGDVLFVASSGFQQRRIERRASDSRSWAIALYMADDGPFRLGNTSPTTIAPSATTGDVSLTASRDIFKPGHVGGLFKLTHSSQSASANIAAQNTFTSEIRVSGLASHNGTASSRGFTIDVSGTFVATVTLQRSIGVVGSWTDVESYAGPTSKTFDDGLDNQIIYYRLGIKTGNYTSGTATCALNYSGSSQSGVVRVQGVTNGTTAAGHVLSEFGAATPTDDWAEGEWSDYRGWPQAVALPDGGARLGWFPGIKAHLSVSDAYASFDSEFEGDSGPINRTVTTGGLGGTRWALALQRLLVATATAIS